MEDIKKYLEGLYVSGLQSITSKEDWISFLDFSARLFKFTFQNTLLIYQQMPNAAACATFEEWNRLKRYIKRNEKGIYCYRKNPITQNYSIACVFDISQTDGCTEAIPQKLWISTKKQSYVFNILENAYGLSYQKKYIQLRILNFSENLLNKVKDRLQVFCEKSNFNFETIYNAIKYSIAYSIAVCFEDVYQKNFMSSFPKLEWNEKVVLLIGTTVNKFSMQVLKIIEMTQGEESNDDIDSRRMQSSISRNISNGSEFDRSMGKNIFNVSRDAFSMETQSSISSRDFAGVSHTKEFGGPEVITNNQQAIIAGESPSCQEECKTDSYGNDSEGTSIYNFRIGDLVYFMDIDKSIKIAKIHSINTEKKTVNLIIMDDENPCYGELKVSVPFSDISSV